ncbi:hypothetical protein BDY21DRAFT_363828 [Lineolata rhizophorae]|uniref:Short-chain dehydrogenase n=1 Tax=Lineolata rhizophorae TaxID=578093 RepID=A0A6A6P1C4_9PEZI|nr:hypothetical protein BDY21DRAFT_363828 [Lineolata rhizophorae]
MATFFSEVFPPKPTFTEKDIPDQHGRVVIVTGGASGCGFEVAKAMYHLNARVYIAGRNKANGDKAIEEIKNSEPIAEQKVKGGKGELFFLQLDLGDLATIKTSAEEFRAKESRLDVVWHNAGVMIPPDNSYTTQGYELQYGTNALGPFVFQHFLTPLVVKTAALAGVKPNATRIIWVSAAAHRGAPKPDGVNWDDVNMKSNSGIRARWTKYAQSKAMNVMQAHEFARRYAADGIVSLSLHPGVLNTNLQRSAPSILKIVAEKIMLKPARFGGLTELYAGLAPDVDTSLIDNDGRNGAYIHPWGRFGDADCQIMDGLKKRGTGERLWKMMEDECKEYM